MEAKFGLQKSLDTVSSLLAMLCALHCGAIPFVVIAFPVVSSSFLADEAFHQFMLWGVVPSGGLAFFLGCQKHKDFYVLLLGSLGMILLILVTFWGHDWLGEVGEKIITIVAGCILVSGHIRNFKLCHKAQFECHH